MSYHTSTSAVTRYIRRTYEYSIEPTMSDEESSHEFPYTSHDTSVNGNTVGHTWTNIKSVQKESFGQTPPLNYFIFSHALQHSQGLGRNQ
jgi:hypothetical protein